jgi:FkbM family methyltransferase
MKTKSAYEVVDARYGRMTVLANDTGAATQSLLTYGEWAENEISFLRHFIAAGSTVLDVGAYIGTHTMAFARFVGSTGRVISVEAQPDTFAVLKKNVEENFATVELENAIASSTSGEIIIPTIDVDRESSFGSASLVSAVSESLPQKSDRASVRSITIDSLGLQECALIKIDVEGVEDMVLNGAAQTLQRCLPIVYCECNSVAAGLRSMDVLARLKFKVFAHVVDAFNPENFFKVQKNIFDDAREIGLVGVPLSRIESVENLEARPCELLLDIVDADDLALALLNKPQYQVEVLRHAQAAKTGGMKFLNQYDSTRNEAGLLRNENAILQKLRAEEREVLEQRIQGINREMLELDQRRVSERQELNIRIQQCDADIQVLRSRAAALKQEIAELHALLNRRDSDIARQQSVLADKASELSGLHDLLTQRDAEIARLNNQVSDQNAELVRVNNLLSTLLASKRWRLTAPVAWVATLIRKVS